jgi:hypothetical protein
LEKWTREDCWSLTNVPQRLFAQHVGIAFTGLGKGNDLVGDGLPNVVGAVADPQGDARHFERNAEDAPHLLRNVRRSEMV